MKSLLLLQFVLFFSVLTGESFAQNFTLKWSNEFKVGKNVLGMDLVAADQTGAYFLESRSAFGSYHPSYQLRKLDYNNNELFFRNYRTDMKDLLFYAIKPLKDKLFLFASDFDKKAGMFKVSGVEIDKASGNFSGEWIELAGIQLNSGKDDVDFVFRPSQDSSSWQLIMEELPDGKEDRTIHIYSFDNALKKVNSGIIKLKGDPETYAYEDLVILNNNGGYFLLIRELENTTPEKKRSTMELKRFVLRKYDTRGNLLHTIPLENGMDKFCLGGRLFYQSSGKVVFAGFYSNSKNKNPQVLNGVFTMTVDENAQKPGILSSIEINREILNGSPADPVGQMTAKDTDNKKNKGNSKDDEKEEGFKREFIIRNVLDGAEEGSLVLVAESYESSYSSSQTSYRTATTTSLTQTEWHYSFHNREVMIIHATNKGELKSIRLIPKYQDEAIDGSLTIGGGHSRRSRHLGYFGDEETSAYYSSITAAKSGNYLYILYNDYAANAALPFSLSENYKVVKDYDKTVLYAVKYELATGKMERTQVFANNKDLIAMPRFSLVSGNRLYLPASKIKYLSATQMNIGLLTIN
jgi:hypothetical protein